MTRPENSKTRYRSHSSKKKKKIKAVPSKEEKTFWGVFTPQTQQQEFCQKISPISSLCTFATLCKNSEKFNASIYYKTSKISFSVTFCPKTPIQDFIPKKLFE